MTYNYYRAVIWMGLCLNVNASQIGSQEVYHDTNNNSIVAVHRNDVPTGYVMTVVRKRLNDNSYEIYCRFTAEVGESMYSPFMVPDQTIAESLRESICSYEYDNSLSN